jgi:hypothetical protein
VALLANQTQAQSPYDPAWTRNFRIGALAGMNIKGDFSLNGQFNVGGNAPGVYDDGYVLVDATGNAGGYTTYWGYQDAAQYDAGTGALLMHSSTGFTANSSGEGQEDFALGFDLAYNWMFKRWERARLGMEFGFGWLPISLKDDAATSATVDRLTYSFNTGGILMPTAPYNGGSSGIGPAIRDTATLVGSDTTSGLLTGARVLNASLYNFRLGPAFFYDVSSRVGLTASLGPAVAIVDETYKFNETLTFTDGSSSRNRGSFSGTDVIYGGFLNLTATYHVEDGGDLYLGVQYMPMSGSTLSEGGRRVDLDFSGQVYFSFGVNWWF